ncbi:MAG TPA: hypothetical protein VGL15_12790 [Vicinamibacteria bacterium]|jgi:3-hydroxyacyl-[acyl-carrier-protein] dehydratase
MAYAKPLLAVDRVLRLDGSGITIEKAITGDEHFFQGHYPGYAVLPGVFVIEAVHQAARRYLESQGESARLEEVRSSRFLAPFRPGDVLVCECRCSKVVHERRLEVEATCRNRGVTAATVKISYRFDSPGA